VAAVSDGSSNRRTGGLIVGAVVGATVAVAANIIQQGVTNGWGNIKVGKAFVAGLKGAISGLFAAATGGAASRAADKAVKKLTKDVKKGVKRAIDIGVQALGGAVGDASVQAVSNGIQAAQGQEVDWARTMLISVGVGAVAGGLGSVLDGWRRGSYDVTSTGGNASQQSRPSATKQLQLRDHLDGLNSMEGRDWGIAIGLGASDTLVTSTLNKFFDDAQNNSETVGNTFSTSGSENAPEPQYNGRMIINSVAGQSTLSSALEDLESSRPSK
jgi:hypothetical protein